MAAMDRLRIPVRQDLRRGEMLPAALVNISMSSIRRRRTKLGSIPELSDDEVDRAIDVANNARRVWTAMDARSRAVILHDIASTLRRGNRPFAECLTREEGKPFKESTDEVSWCATSIDYYAELARHETGRLAGATVPGQFHSA